MSRQRALDAISGIMTDRIPQIAPLDSPAVAEKLFDYDIWENPERTNADLVKHFDIDMTTSFNGIAEWNFPLVRYYADVEFLDDESCNIYRRVYGKKRPVRPYESMEDSLERPVGGAWWGISPTLCYKSYGFSSPEDVLRFNPLEHDKSTLEQRIEFFQQFYGHARDMVGDSSLIYGWYYNTLFMWPVEVFGWENSMLAAMMDPKRFKEIMDQFLHIVKRDITAMSAVEDLPVIACHDDLCSANGPMFSPDWYDENIFPYYDEIFDIIRQTGNKIIYVCDGNVIPLLDRIYDTGVDGIAIDGNSDLTTVMEKFSGKIVQGGLDPTVVSQGTFEDIEKQVKEVVQIVKGEPGYFFQNTGLTGQTPAENIVHYQHCLREYGSR